MMGDGRGNNAMFAWRVDAMSLLLSLSLRGTVVGVFN